VKFDTIAVLFASGESKGDDQIVREIIDFRRKKLNAIPAIRQFLDTGALAKTDPKSVERKFRDFEASQSRAAGHMDVHAVLEGVRRTIGKNAKPAEATQHAKAWLDTIENALKGSKPPLVP
jgi:hypothetical protein